MNTNTTSTATTCLSRKSLDCPSGLGCGDYECELRHLDAQEQVQQQEQEQRSLQTKPNCIVTASRDMGRTASTWVFNAVRLLHRQANNSTAGCDSYWMRELSAPKIRDRLDFASTAARTVLIKTHEFAPYYTSPEQFQQEILPLVTHVIVSCRNGFDPDPAWMKHATLVVHYEDILLANPTHDPNLGSLKVLRQMAQHIGLSTLSDSDLQQVDYQLMTLPIPGDQSSKFWSFHARRGGRTCPPPPPTSSSQSTTTPRLIFVTRHGARLDNGPDRDPHWLAKETRHNRPTDAPLSPLGHIEAQELAEEVRKRMTNHDCTGLVIVSSPYIRCLETALAVAQHCSVPTIHVEPGIAEVGSTASSMGSDEELTTTQNYSFSSWLNTSYQPVMTRQQLSGREWGDAAAAQRAQRVARIVASEKFPTAPAILFVGHGASCLGLVSAFGAPQEYIGYCSLTQFQSTTLSTSSSSGGGGGGWKLVGEMGSVDHLSDPQVSLDSAW